MGCHPVSNSNSNINLSNNNTIPHVQTMIEEEMKISSSSSDSSIIHHSNKIIRRRKKKKKLNETERDIDSGYLNGPESSSELTSETELLTAVTNEDKNLKKDISTDNSQLTISFEFGDVKEILEDRENIQKVTEIELRNNQQSLLKPELEIKVPIEEDVNSEFDSKSLCVLISQEK